MLVVIMNSVGRPDGFFKGFKMQSDLFTHQGLERVLRAGEAIARLWKATRTALAIVQVQPAK